MMMRTLLKSLNCLGFLCVALVPGAVFAQSAEKQNRPNGDPRAFRERPDSLELSVSP